MNDNKFQKEVSMTCVKTHLQQLIDDRRFDKFFLNQTGAAYVSVRIGEAFQILPVRGKDYRRLLVERFYTLTGRTLNANTLDSVLSLLETRASATGRIHLENRFARRGETLWLDLADDARRAVKITRDGWKTVRLRRIIFKRYTHQLDIPRPKRGGDVREIFDYLNLADDEQKLLILAWLGCVFIADVPRPILHLSGPQGSAKTTQAKILRSLIDPSKAETIHLFTNASDLAQILEHNAVPLFDNLSWINAQVSDMLCSAVTGSGFIKRSLYSDEDDVIFNYKRPMIITAINTPTAAPDLLDRFVLIRTTVPKERRSEAELWKGFNNARPRILGGLLDIVAKAMRHIDKIEMTQTTRMVDFAHWGTAIAVALGYKADEFIEALSKNVQRQVDEVIQSNPVAEGIERLLVGRRRWKGTATELLNELNDLIGDNISVPGWPKSPNHLIRRLNALQTALRGAGIEYRTGKSKGGKLVLLRKVK
jgi:hypothetical protein